MFGLLFGKKKQKEAIKPAEETLEELRKQDRNLPPRFRVYPFTLLVKSGVEIPYTQSVDEIRLYLVKNMVHFEAGVIALVWKGDYDSFQVLTKELHNKDYYRRKVVLEYMIYHDLFEENSEVLGIAVLDGHDMVVKSALKKILKYRPVGIREEIRMAMECWPDDAEIQKMCKTLLTLYRESYTGVMSKQYAGREKRAREELIYRDSSQYILKERMDNLKYFTKYNTMVKHYKPYADEQTVAALLETFADEGCGYASLATTLVLHYAEKEKEFISRFKCELKQNDAYVTDLLMLDFYCMTDEANRGMTVEQMSERFDKYCDSYGIKVQMNILEDMDYTTWQRCTKTGYLLLFAGHFTMYYKKYHPTKVGGWHIMNISDMQQDGTMTIVTWGKKYTLKKEDLRNSGQFVHVEYLN